MENEQNERSETEISQARLDNFLQRNREARERYQAAAAQSQQESRSITEAFQRDTGMTMQHLTGDQQVRTDQNQRPEGNQYVDQYYEGLMKTHEEQKQQPKDH